MNTAYPTWRRIGALSVAMTVGLSTWCLAQPAAEPSWTRVDRVQVRPDMWSEFVKIQREEVNPALQKAGVPWRSVWRTAEFGDIYTELFVTPMANFAQYDGADPLTRALEPRARERLLNKIRRCIVSTQSYAERYREDLSTETEDISDRPIAVVTTMTVAPGRGQEFERFLRETLAGLEKVDAVYGVYQRVYGPGPTAWLIVENLRSFSELDRQSPITRAFGAEGAGKILAQLAGMVTSIDRSVLELHSELSY